MLNRTAESSTKPASLAIATREYAQRRDRLLRDLKGAAALVLAGDGGSSLHGPPRIDSNFRYLTGLADEPGAALLFDPSAEDPRRRIILLLKPLNPETERWDGYRDPISANLKERLGFTTIMRVSALSMLLTAAARRTKRLACLHPFAGFESPVSPDLAIFRKISERIPGCAIEDRTGLLRAARSVKSKAELALMRRAIEITAKGFAAATTVIRPGAGEAAVQRAIERTYADLGAEGTAYDSIVGSGLNGTVLHYRANNAPTLEGELLVIDSGAQFAGYAADITRTYPVSGRFTREQRDLYTLVLDAQEAAIKVVRPGATMTDVGWAARKIIDKAGLGDAYIHGIGHHLGMEVHDLDADAKLAPGMVITIEPGVYLPQRKTGIRIEDDILVTPRGSENLSKMIPKSINAVEQAMKRRR